MLRARLALALLVVPTAVTADVKGPQGDAPVFRYVYPAAASTATIDKLYRDDLKSLQDEAARLAETDGGTLSGDHRAYLATRQAAIERRRSEALVTHASVE